MKNILVIAVLSIAPLLAQAATLTPLEKEVRDLSRAQQVNQANLLLSQEQKYNDKLKSYISKAEAAKELELVQKLKDEYNLSSERIEDYKVLIKGEAKIIGTKFMTDGGEWVLIKNATTLMNNWHPTEKDAFTVKRVDDKFCFVKDGKVTNDGYVIGDNGNSLTYAGIMFYRQGFAPKKEKKVEDIKTETENTAFGRRVKF